MDNNNSSTPPQNGAPNNKNSNKPKPKVNMYWLYGIFMLLMIGYLMIDGNQNSLGKTSFTKFKTDFLAKNYVSKIKLIDGKNAEVYLKKEVLKTDSIVKILKAIEDPKINLNNNSPAFMFTIGDQKQFEEDLNNAVVAY